MKTKKIYKQRDCADCAPYQITRGIHTCHVCGKPVCWFHARSSASYTEIMRGDTVDATLCSFCYKTILPVAGPYAVEAEVRYD